MIKRLYKNRHLQKRKRGGVYFYEKTIGKFTIDTDTMSVHDADDGMGRE